MHVVIIGLGEVGRHLIRTLEWERADIVAIDIDQLAPPPARDVERRAQCRLETPGGGDATW